MKKLSIVAIIFFTGFANLFAQNKISLAFDNGTNISFSDKEIQVQKFSDYLKVTASGYTQLNNKSIKVSVSLSCPKFNFLAGKTNHYKNAENHFLDARADAILSVCIDTITYATDFRSKDSGNVISHVNTTNYEMNAANTSSLQNKNYLIELNAVAGTILKQSSEVLKASEVKSIIISNASFTLINPQPALPKVKSSFIEVTGNTQPASKL
ncbi:MAG: hypothetical protein PW786_09205 [Arachidicoccus sp.]|nr:hypothetical protein [Arachidicoccus sp.]